MKKLLVVVIALSAISSLQALEQPKASSFDSRIQYVNYNPSDVVIVRAAVGMGSRIVFGKDEEILDVASGFTQGWEFSDRKNILYIKPKSIDIGQGQDAQTLTPEPVTWDTNLMVTTNKYLYDIDLKLLPEEASKRVAYRVEYKYPAEEAAEARARFEKERTAKKLEQKPAPRNKNYSMQIGKASRNIAPSAAWDDGRFTYLTFPNNRDFPAAFLVAEDKTESLVNSHVDPKDPDTLVIHRVAKQMVLRLGNQVIGIYNDGYSSSGLPTSGTTIDGVERVIQSTGVAQ